MVIRFTLMVVLRHRFSMNHFVVMGVSGCGKSTIARHLAEQIKASMIEADDFHPLENVEKMRCGEPLNDEERWPWLKRVARALKNTPAPVVVSCSALRRSYRQCLLDTAGVPIGFIHLHGSGDVIARRMSSRSNHFMPTTLLDSQLSLLEPLDDDETGVVVDIGQSIESVVAAAVLYTNYQNI